MGNIMPPPPMPPLRPVMAAPPVVLHPAHPDEFDYFGVDLDFQSHGAIFIEWPEKIEKFNCPNEIDLRFENSKSKRVVKIASNNSEISGYINRIDV